MAPKRHEPYVGHRPRRGRREEVQDTSVPTPEVEQPEFQEEVGDTPQTNEGPYHSHQEQKDAERRPRPEGCSIHPPIAPSSEEVPLVPTSSTKVPLNQPLAMPTKKIF